MSLEDKKKAEVGEKESKMQNWLDLKSFVQWAK